MRKFQPHELEEIQIDGIDTKDYPDFCDAYVCYAELDGRELTQGELDYVNDDKDFVYNQILKRIY